jgi:hypothetical protein
MAMYRTPPQNYYAFGAQSTQQHRPVSEEVMQKLRKTEICRFFKKGKCNRHSTCSFAHSYEELESRPDLRKTKMCFNYYRNGCSDENCPFAHTQQELRALPGNENKPMLPMAIKSTEGIWREDYTQPKHNKSSKRRQQHQKEVMGSPLSTASTTDSTPPLSPRMLDSSPLSQEGYFLPSDLFKSPKAMVEGYEIQVKGTFVNLIPLEEIDYKGSLRRTSSESALPSPAKA